MAAQQTRLPRPGLARPGRPKEPHRLFWVALAAPGILWLLVLFIVPFYTMIAIAAGYVNPVFGYPVAVWNPLNWSSANLSAAWRDLVGDQPDARAPDRPAAPAPPAKTAPAPPAGTPAGPQEKAAPQGDPPRPNGHAQRGSEASEKQIAAIFAIGKSKGYTSDDLKALVKEKLGKSVPALTSREASKLIDDLHAL